AAGVKNSNNQRGAGSGSRAAENRSRVTCTAGWARGDSRGSGDFWAGFELGCTTNARNGDSHRVWSDDDAGVDQRGEAGDRDGGDRGGRRPGTLLCRERIAEIGAVRGSAG